MKNKKICLISSTGGHFEQLQQLELLKEKYSYYYVLPKSDSFNNLNAKKYIITGISRKNKLKFLFIFTISFLRQLFIFIKERPDAVITTGAGFVVPTCLIAKFFHKKVIYIESFARMKSLNKTGGLLYKYADLFIVQWEELLKICPNAVYGGWIY